MTKTAEKPSESATSIDVPAFDPSKATDQLRAVA